MDQEKGDEAPRPRNGESGERNRAEEEAFRLAARRYSRISARLRRHPR